MNKYLKYQTKSYTITAKLKSVFTREIVSDKILEKDDKPLLLLQNSTCLRYPLSIEKKRGYEKS